MQLDLFHNVAHLFPPIFGPVTSAAARGGVSEQSLATNGGAPISARAASIVGCRPPSTSNRRSLWTTDDFVLSNKQTNRWDVSRRNFTTDLRSFYLVERSLDCQRRERAMPQHPKLPKRDQDHAKLNQRVQFSFVLQNAINIFKEKRRQSNKNKPGAFRSMVSSKAPKSSNSRSFASLSAARTAKKKSQT